MISDTKIIKALKGIKARIDNKQVLRSELRDIITSEFHKLKPAHEFFYVTPLETGKYDKNSAQCTVTLEEFIRVNLFIHYLGNNTYRVAGDIVGYVTSDMG